MMRKRQLDTPVVLREGVSSSDADAVRSVVTATGFFNEEEIAVAVELVEERLAKGEHSGYFFVFAELGGSRLAGYACYGPIPGTASSFDLYWVAVRPDMQGRGLGKRLVSRSEELITGAGGTRVYIDTSSRAQYVPTRGFYESCGYKVEAVLDDFYAPGDSKVVYLKVVR